MALELCCDVAFSSGTYLPYSGFTEQNELHTATRFWCRSCGLSHDCLRYSVDYSVEFTADLFRLYYVVVGLLAQLGRLTELGVLHYVRPAIRFCLVVRIMGGCFRILSLNSA